MTACSEIGEKLIIFQFQASIESMQSGDSRMCYLTSSEVRTFPFLILCCLCSLTDSQGGLSRNGYLGNINMVL